jgi:hypothetical protein
MQMYGGVASVADLRACGSCGALYTRVAPGYVGELGARSIAGGGKPSAELNLMETRFVALPNDHPYLEEADLEYVQVRV